jgi:hypothetical protein
MNITGILKTLIEADTEVYAVLGSRIYPAIVPEKTLLPCARILKLATEPNETKSGPSEHDFLHIQISVYAETYKQAETANERIRAVLDSFYGVVTTSDSVAHLIGRIVFQDSSDQYDDRPAVFHVASDYLCRVTRQTSSVTLVAGGLVPLVTTVTASTATVQVAPGALVSKIVVISNVESAVKCGTSAGGDQVMKTKYTKTDTPMVADIDYYSIPGGTLYFSGLAGTTKIVVYTQ